MSIDLTISDPLNQTPQPVRDQEGTPTPLQLQKNGPVTILGGGAPPLVVQGSPANYAMLGLRGDQSNDAWQLQATNGGVSEFRISYPQNDAKLTIAQDGTVTITGDVRIEKVLSVADLKLTNLPDAPSGANLDHVVVDRKTGALYRTP